MVLSVLVLSVLRPVNMGEIDRERFFHPLPGSLSGLSDFSLEAGDGFVNVISFRSYPNLLLEGDVIKRGSRCCCVSLAKSGLVGSTNGPALDGVNHPKCFCKEGFGMFRGVTLEAQLSIGVVRWGAGLAFHILGC